MGQQLDGAKAANRQTDDNLGHSIDQVGAVRAWLGQGFALELVPKAAGGKIERQHSSAHKSMYALRQVARELSGAAEGQRMKREQIGRNANKASELQAQVGGAGLGAGECASGCCRRRLQRSWVASRCLANIQ